MLNNYVKIAFKHLFKNKSLSLINLIGLSVSMTASLFIFLYIESEYSYDKNWKDSELIYRISETVNMQGEEVKYALSSFKVAEDLKARFPEIEEAGRLMYWMRNATLTKAQTSLEINNIYYADSCFLHIFNHDFVEGNPYSALTAQNSIVISEHLAQSFFGRTQVLGEELKMDKKSLTVTGVFREHKKETHIPVSALISASTYSQATRERMSNDWLWQVCYTYIKFTKPESVEQFRSKLQNWEDGIVKPFVEQNELNLDIDFKLMPIKDIHLRSEFSYEMPSNSTEKYVQILAFVALFILLIAAINYMNLATSKASLRSLEVGLRKSLGAQRSQLIKQFLTESLFITLMALVLAIGLIAIFLPAFNSFTGKNFDFFTNIFNIQQVHIWSVIIGVALFTGLISGTFPAFVLSAFSPLLALKGGNAQQEKNLTVQLRKFLVILQLTISTGMIIVTLIINNQMDFLTSRNLGFNDEQVLVIKYPKNRELRNQSQAVKQKILQIPGVTSACLSKNLPGYTCGNLLFYFKREGVQEQQMINLFQADEEFLSTLDIPLLKGKGFSKESLTNQENGLIINEACAKFLGWDNPIGKEMVSGYTPKGEIIGVMKDFNFKSLHNTIEPLILIYKKTGMSLLAIKFESQNSSAVIHALQKLWNDFAPNHELHYDFLDDHFAQLYKREEKLFQIFSLFSGLIILIAGLGLLGLTSFILDKKMKEIAIRKVLGAKSGQLLMLLSKDFLIWLMVANIIAWPTCYYLMEKWLMDFEYRIVPGWSSFALASLFSLLLTCGTVLKMGWTALQQDPAKLLQNE
ncbi:MAG: ABC transporter permease [Marinifilaceae bacterium]